MSSEQKQIKPQVKALFFKGYVEALSVIEKAQKTYTQLIQKPDNATGEKFLEAVVNLKLAKAKMDALIEKYLEEGGSEGELQVIYK